jgi:hypothetical protein
MSICTHMAYAPRLMTAYMILLNQKTRSRLRRAAIAGTLACIGALAAALLMVERGPIAQMLDWLRHHGPMAAGLTAMASAAAVARRRVLTRAEFARSWLGAVPTRATAARWESLILEAAPAGAAMVVLVIIFSLAASRAALVVCAWLSGGVILGAIVSYAIPAPKPQDLPPGSRYVPHLRIGKASAMRPSLKSLGQWPVRRMFARAQPQMVARAIVPVLVMMPLGATADNAMVVVCLFLVAGSLSLLIPAVISVSALVRRWMAPLPVTTDSLMRTYLLPSLGTIVGAGAVAAWLLFILGASGLASVAAGLGAAVLGVLIVIGTVYWQLAPTGRTR